ncbi:MAG: hypothetical protein ABIR34_11305 [Marmoricola sp.]
MLLTIGQALDRAKDDELTVRMHIGGEWITGRVLNSDGHGVAVLENNGDVCVVRQDTINCVRLPSRVNEQRVPAQQGVVVEQQVVAIERH